ncbi:carbohydrate kinase family protein [Leptolyngbya iicbica]|uniref:Carbohydrate kinase n=1 Tax=Lyngbya confervoides BDU141951 TaxID=1574623 RepID=A0A8T6QWQ5_9CYAN|nr:carbohydrate kinase [Leptolyngbya sp. LK]
MLNKDGLVICLGEVLIDQVVDTLGRRQNYAGGAPANVAVALARLGLPVGFVGGVGRDAEGQYLIQTLQQQAVDCGGLQHCDAPTRIVEVTCTAAGDRTFGGFIGGATTDFADTQLAAPQLPFTSLSTAACLVTGTLGLAYPTTRAAMRQAATTVQAAGGKLVIDVNWRPTFWPDVTTAMDLLRPWLCQADVIKVSADEAIALWQTADIDCLKAQFPQADWLVTDGDRGCQAVLGGYRAVVPAFAVPAVETTGAGDAFLAGMLYQLLQHDWQFESVAQLTDALIWANAMGALTTLKSGAIAALPTPVEILSFLHTHTGKVWTMGGV